MPLPDLRVVGRHDADPGVAEQVGGGQVADHAVRHEQAVDGGQQRLRALGDRGGDGAEDQADAGGQRVHLAGQPRAVDRDGVVGGEDGELAFLAGRLEARLAGEHALEHLAGGGRAVEQHRAERGQLVPGAAPDQQLVTEVAAQPGQRGAHRRLAEADPLPRPRDVALSEQRAQRDDQVHVEAGQVHGVISPVTRVGRGGQYKVFIMWMTSSQQSISQITVLPS